VLLLVPGLIFFHRSLVAFLVIVNVTQAAAVIYINCVARGRGRARYLASGGPNERH
jgi:hypothetical protein